MAMQQRLYQQVQEVLENDPRVDARKVKVTVAGSVVFLSGRVSSYASISVAEHIVRKIPGVTEVRNLLLSQFTPLFALPEDKVISADLERSYRWDAGQRRVIGLQDNLASGKDGAD